MLHSGLTVVGMKQWHTLFKVRIMAEFVSDSASRSGNGGGVCVLTFLPLSFYRLFK